MSFWKKTAIAFTVLAAVPVAGTIATTAESTSPVASVVPGDTPWG